MSQLSSWSLVVMVVGSGGREAAICAALNASETVRHVICAPGNPGMENVKCLPVSATDIVNLIDTVNTYGVDLVIFGPEVPLAEDYATELREKTDAVVVGPCARGAQLEFDKAVAMNWLKKWGVPIPGGTWFGQQAEALKYVREQEAGCVVKANGLAAGKGVFVCHTPAEAEQAVISLMQDRVLGSAGEFIIVQELLTGWETSCIVMVSNGHYEVLGYAGDYKRRFEEDEGPNTGGMGAIAPDPRVTPDLADQIREQIIAPTMRGLAARELDYRGVIFFGLMVTANGPKVLEINVRFGDPETQALLPLLQTDFGELMLRTANATLDLMPEMRMHEDECAVCVAIVSEGYPGKDLNKGNVITGIEEARASYHVDVYTAGVTENEDGQLVNSGGRVIYVGVRGVSFAEARKRAYDAVALIKFEGASYRTDIAGFAL